MRKGTKIEEIIFTKKHRKDGILHGFTLVETMISFAVFAIVCLGSLGLLTFSLKTMENARTMTQVSKILTHEMETMRMRGWSDRPITTEDNKKITLYGLYSLGRGKRDSDNTRLSTINNDTEEPIGVTVETDSANTLTDAYTTYKVHPFAVYGITDSTSKKAGTLGIEINTGTKPIINKSKNYEVTRKVHLKRSKSDYHPTKGWPTVDHAVITITVKWSDDRGSHSRNLSSTLSKNGLSDFYYRTLL